MGGSSSQSAEVIAASDAGGLERVQYIEHRRRSSLINMEETMMSRKMDHQAPAAGIKVVSKASFRGKPPNVTCTIRFSPEAELFTRPRTTRQDKPTLHYNSTDFAMVRQIELALLKKCLLVLLCESAPCVVCLLLNADAE